MEKHGRVARLDRTQQSREWRLRIGHAIDVLRTDVEQFPDESHVPDFTIFSEDVEFQDARLPEFRLQGLATYQRVVSTLKWSLLATCAHSRMEVTAMSPPINEELYMRWRLRSWPRDVLATATDFLLSSQGTGITSTATGESLVVEGYSRYRFDPWTADIVKHTIDITNPPMLISDLLSQHAGGFVWAPMGVGVGVPKVANYMEGVAALVPPSLSSPSVWNPSWPQGCEDDYECNDGQANFPLQCCELPLLGRFCCEPEDFRPTPEQPAYVPLPVPVDEWSKRADRPVTGHNRSTLSWPQDQRDRRVQPLETVAGGCEVFAH